jgi:hypothetical protein
LEIIGVDGAKVNGMISSSKLFEEKTTITLEMCAGPRSKIFPILLVVRAEQSSTEPLKWIWTVKTHEASSMIPAYSAAKTLLKRGRYGGWVNQLRLKCIDIGSVEPPWPMNGHARVVSIDSEPPSISLLSSKLESQEEFKVAVVDPRVVPEAGK